MDLFAAGLTNLAGILIFALIATGLAKVFQIAATLSEIKELLTDVKRNTENYLPEPRVSSAQSPESILRAVSAELDLEERL